MRLTAGDHTVDRLPGLDDNADPPAVVMSFGLGLDSTALLMRWIVDPAARDFDLRDLTLVTAMTGHESVATREAMSRLVLPRLREHSIRFVQVARSRRKTTRAGDGIVVLDDSRHPDTLHAQGAFTLGDEMLSAATLPQRGGSRLCSVHSKGDVLDPVIARITKGNRFRHVMGFEANEDSRAAKDRLHDSDRRRGEYPLQSWGWTREHCNQFLLDTIGESVPKSCCGFCPFAMSTVAGRNVVVDRYRREPHLGAEAMFLEHVARSVNPAQTLIEGSSVADLVAGAGLTNVQALFDESLRQCAWSLYEVRRVVRSGRNGRAGITARSLRVLDTGSREAMAARLGEQAGVPLRGPDGILRHVVRCRASGGVDHLFVAAPAGAEPKQRSGFEQWWQEATGDGLF